MAGPLYFLAGGGTAGHINPALSIGAAIQREDPNAKVYYMVTEDGLEKDMVAESGQASLQISASELPKDFGSLLRFIGKTSCGLWSSIALIRKYKPNAVIGTGGYVGAPMLLAAKWMKVPILIHEQNSIPGRSNRQMASFAKSICLSFEGSESYFSASEQERCVLTGNPIKKLFFERKREECRRELGLSEDTELIVIMGGSLGSRRINQAVGALPHLPEWNDFLREHPKLMICLSGGSVNSRFLEDIPEDESHIQSHNYIDSTLWMPAADLLVGRAGAGFLMETAACGVPSILIPFPQAADGHQKANAEVFVDHGASIMIEDELLDGKRLLEALKELMSRREMLKEMGAAAYKLATPRAAEDIAAECRRIAATR